MHLKNHLCNLYATLYGRFRLYSVDVAHCAALIRSKISCKLWRTSYRTYF